MNGKPRIGALVFGACCLVGGAFGQEAEQDRGWKLGAGLSYISTSGNSDTSSWGLAVDWEREFALWNVKSGFSALQTTENNETVAEKHRVYRKGDREISNNLALTAGLRGERNRFAGIDLHSTFNLGVAWKVVESRAWKFETSGSATWNHENQVEGGADENNVGLLLSTLSQVAISESASTTQALLVEPSIEDSDDYRVELAVSLEASLTQVLALKIGFNSRYDNAPVLGFEKTDTETTASLVVRTARGSLGR